MSNILSKIFDFTRRIGENNPWLKKTFLWQSVVCPIYTRVRALSGNLTFAKGARAYFKQNAERVNQVANLFSDQESKKTYIGMINFRQTGKKNYHICHGAHAQYFINDFFTYGKNEVLIDCGACIGDTIENFLKLPNMKYEQIVAFEPNTDNFKILENKFGANIGGGDGIMLINSGVYSKDCVLYFSGNNLGGHISEVATEMKDETSVKVCAIDNLPNLKTVTFIKMDIEGAEMEALKGSQKTILRDKPRLAISIYHSNEDMLRIAEWIHNIVPQYKFYCRMHGEYPTTCDTILYAQIEEDW